MAELVCLDLEFSYRGDPILSGLDLVVPPGGLTAILGSSGSGKTTLLRLIMGFLYPGRGAILLDGIPLSAYQKGHLPPEKRGIGYVSQEGALYPHLNVGENVGFGLARSQRKKSRRILEVLELVNLDARYAAKRVQELSGGEQRRVALARALAPRPRAILLDEPFSGLDSATRAETRHAVTAALREARTTALLVTHDQAEALSVGDEVAVLRDGKIIQRAKPKMLYGQPADIAAARFIGETVLMAGVAVDNRVRCALGDLPYCGDVAEGKVWAAIRPEQICLRTLPSTHVGSRHHTRSTSIAEVFDSEFSGATTRVGLRLMEGDFEIIATVLSPNAPEVGQLVELSVLGSVAVYSDDEGAAGEATQIRPAYHHM